MAEPCDYNGTWSTFHKELDKLQLCMPGSGANEIPFSYNHALLDMVRKQYPHWREVGNVTSVPIARIPKLFLQSIQLTKELQDTFRSTQKGDGAEKKLYKLFVGETFSNQPGIIVFPNFDGSELFKTQDAKVEIDMILVHQSKGIFIFNVKNVGGRKSKKIRNDIKKHSNLVRMLLNYKNPNSEHFIPIHTIVCNFHDSSNLYSDLEKQSGNDQKTTKNNQGRTLVFNKDQLTQQAFKKSWLEKLGQAGIKNVTSNERLEIFVARLIGLSSLEGSLALIHEKIEKNIAQSIGSQEHWDYQFKECPNDKDFVNQVATLSKTTSNKGREKFILWTKEQIEIIGKVYAHLNDGSTSKGLRLLVAGCKGSGKTVLLTFIAQLAEEMKKSGIKKSEGNILVCDGSFSSPILHKRLQQIFSKSGVSIFSNSMAPENFSRNRGLGDKHYGEMCGAFAKQLSEASFLLCDEYDFSNNSILLKNLREDQHCLLFTSLNRPKSEQPENFATLPLSVSLRSTANITDFANLWWNIAHLERYYFKCKKANNLEGENVHIKVFNSNKNPPTIKNFGFTDSCVDIICEYFEKSKGMNTLPIVPLLDEESYESVLSKLKDKNYNVCVSNSNELGTDVQTDELFSRVGPSDLPCVRFFKPGEIEGSEFGVVIILIGIKHVAEIPARVKHRFFSAITRATSKLVIVLNETQLSGCKEYVNKNEKSCPCVQEGAEKQFNRHMVSILSNSPKKPSTLFVGRKPEAPFKKVESSNSSFEIPNIDGLTVYREERNEGAVLYIDDLFKKKDLEILHNFGVRSILLMPSILECRFTYDFYNKSGLCIEEFCKKCQNLDLFMGMSHTRRDSDLFSVVNFCMDQAGMEISSEKLGIKARYNYDRFEANNPYFCWEKWVEKGDEIFGLEYTNRAFEIYNTSLTLLEKLYTSEITKTFLNSGKSERIELAKLNFSVGGKYLDLAIVETKKETYFSWPAAGSKYYGYYVSKLLQHFVQSIRWNAAYEEIYNSFPCIFTTIINQCQKQILELKNSAPQKDSQKDDISRKFKLGMRGDQIQRMFDWPVLFAMSAVSPEYKKMKDEFEQSVERYKILISTGKKNEKEKEKLTQCRYLAILAANLSRESLKLTSGQLPESSEDEVSFWSVKQVVNEIGQIMDHPVRQAFEAWFWDPLVIDGYEALSAAVKKLQVIVNQLHARINKIDKDLYLSECLRVEKEERGNK